MKIPHLHSQITMLRNDSQMDASILRGIKTNKGNQDSRSFREKEKCLFDCFSFLMDLVFFGGMPIGNPRTL